MNLDFLKQACDQRQIKRIAIVDDVFDTPDPEKIDPGSYRGFVKNYNSNKNFRGSISRVIGDLYDDRLPDFDDLDDEDIAPLWTAFWKQSFGGRKMKGQYAQYLKELFKNHGDDVLGMHDTVVGLFSMFRDELNTKVKTYGTQFDPKEVVKAEIIFIDFFLEVNISKEVALKKVMEIVKELTDAARSSKRGINATVVSLDVQPPTRC